MCSALADWVADEFRARDLGTRRAQPKHRASQMFRGVNFAVDVQNLLRAWNAQVIYELMAEVPEAGAKARARCGGHPGAARAAVKVKAEIRLFRAQGFQRWRGRLHRCRGCLRRSTRKRSSTMTATRRSGRARLRISRAGVVRTQSPSERRRNTATRAPRGSWSRARHLTLRFSPRLSA